MSVNIVFVTGLGYSLIGALIMLVSHRALYEKASRIVAGYPKVLAALRIQRHDARCGFIILLAGNILQLIAACGYSVPSHYWGYSAASIVSLLLLYALWQSVSRWRVKRADAAARRDLRMGYETRRSVMLLEAARREAANGAVRDKAKSAPDRRIVYVTEDWECRWWSEKLGVPVERLRAAVREVGPMVGDIERHLGVLQPGRRPRAA
jgi:hypothetical protein